MVEKVLGDERRCAGDNIVLILREGIVPNKPWLPYLSDRVQAASGGTFGSKPYPIGDAVDPTTVVAKKAM